MGGSRCRNFEMFEMCDVRDLKYLECEMLVIWEILNVGCSVRVMLRMWSILDVRCREYGIFGKCDVHDVECSICEMLGI